MSTYPSDSSETRPIPGTPDEKRDTESFAFQYDSSRSRLASPDQDFGVPDGGLIAWMTVAGAWLVLFSTFGYLYSFGVYETFYSLEYLTNHTPSSIAWIGSFQLMMPFALGIVSGKLFDNGYFHLLQITGGIIFVVSLFMLSLAKPFQYYQIFLSQGLGMGIGLGLTFVPACGISSHHFAKRRALATGIAHSGTSAGATIFPIMINHLIPKVGFAAAVRASGYVVLGCLVIGNAMMRTRPRPPRVIPDIKSFFADGAYLFAVAGTLLSTAGVYIPVIYMQLFSVQHSVGSSLAFYSIAIMNGTSAIGRVAGNYLADIYGPFYLQVGTTLITAGTIFAVLGVHNSTTLILVSVLYGIFSGAWLALSIASLASLARTPDEVGARTGIALALGSFGSLGSAPIQGALLTSNFLWMRPIAFSGAIVAASAVCFLGTSVLAGRRSSTR
ncbi:MFS general substrate transporter [Mycena albidolilacea]|uniref:MFS general substrate transporter n=1 Tax=Mycena albidolilacea TaxID=1033008 RepID=A0AAD7EZ51_9AGAR|nr:MFS general substrate transporter [Mycena albidolilacea]